MDPNKIGIYFSSNENKVVRITSPYWLPEEPEWVMVQMNLMPLCCLFEI